MPFATDIYQLEITLAEIEPRISRRVLIPADATFSTLHDTIQRVFGWSDAHLHDFSTRKRCGRYMAGRIADMETLDGLAPWEKIPEDERVVRLRERILRVGQRLAYCYDFGDSWEHVILLEKIREAEPGVLYPLCIAGERACPPEDCGGASGYARLLALLADADHEEHRRLVQWLDIGCAGEFDPEACDLGAINGRLREGDGKRVRRSHRRARR